MSSWSLGLWFEPVSVPSANRIIASNRSKQNPHLAINSSGVIGYYASGSFVSIGGAVTLGYVYHMGFDWSDAGDANIYLNGNHIGHVASGFPQYAVNELGNHRAHEFIPSDDLIPSDWLIPVSNGGTLALPCKGKIDEPAIWNRRLTAGEWADLAQGATLSKVYNSADYYLDSANDDNLISPIEKVTYYRSDWLKISNNDQQTTSLPNVIASIVYEGEYKTLATKANAVSIWTPSTPSTQAYNYYQAIEAYRLYLFDSSTNGFLLTSNMEKVSSVNGDTLDAILANVIKTSNELSIAISAADATAKSNTAQTNAEDYADTLDEALREQTDRAIVYYEQTTDPSTAWTTDELKILHKWDKWRDSTLASNPWKEWTGTAWQTISDPAALAVANAAGSAASAAQTTANKKSTLWSTLAIANTTGNGVVGDMFIDSGLVYRATVAAPSITVANSVRITVKNWGNIATAPTSGMIANDTYYNTATLAWYYYTGSSWAIDGTSLPSVVPTYAPQYRGIGVLSSTTNATFTGATVDTNGTITVGSSVTANAKDWVINYAATNVPIGLYVLTSGTWTLSTSVAYLDSCSTDLFNLKVGGIAVAGYDTVITGIYKNLFAQSLKILTGGKIFSGVGNYNNTDTPVYIDANGNLSLGDKFIWNGTTLTVNGIINATSGAFTGPVTSSSSMSYAGSGYQTKLDRNGITIFYPAGGGTLTNPLEGDIKTVITEGVMKSYEYDTSWEEDTRFGGVAFEHINSTVINTGKINTDLQYTTSSSWITVGYPSHNFVSGYLNSYIESVVYNSVTYNIGQFLIRIEAMNPYLGGSITPKVYGTRGWNYYSVESELQQELIDTIIPMFLQNTSSGLQIRSANGSSIAAMFYLNS